MLLSPPHGTSPFRTRRPWCGSRARRPASSPEARQTRDHEHGRGKPSDGNECRMSKGKHQPGKQNDTGSHQNLALNGQTPGAPHHRHARRDARLGPAFNRCDAAEADRRELLGGLPGTLTAMTDQHDFTILRPAGRALQNLRQRHALGPANPHRLELVEVAHVNQSSPVALSKAPGQILGRYRRIRVHIKTSRFLSILP